MVSVRTSRPWGGWLCLGYHACFLSTCTLLSPPDYMALLCSGCQLSLDKYNYALDRNKSKHKLCHPIGSATVTCEKKHWWQVFTHLRWLRSKSENNDSSLKDVFLIELIREKSTWGHFYCNEMGQLWLLRLEWASHWPILLLCYCCYENTDLFWPKQSVVSVAKFATNKYSVKKEMISNK